MAQSRCYVHTLGPKVDTMYILGALGFDLVWHLGSAGIPVDVDTKE